MKTWILLGCAVLSVGCATRKKAPTTAWSAEGDPLTLIAFEDATTWPFELADVQITLDGATLLDHHAPPNTDTQWAFEVPIVGLPHGDHTVVVDVRARYASTRMDASEGCAVRWRDARTFGVAGQPVGVRIVADSEGVTRRFVDRLDVDIQVAGATCATPDTAAPERTLIAESTACQDDGPLPFGDEDLSAVRFGPDLLR